MNSIQNQFKIRASLGAKLFFYMSLLVVITIAGLSTQFYRSYKKFQTTQVQDSIQIQAEKASGSIETLLDGWKTSIAVNMQNFRASDGAFVANKIQEYLDGNQDYIFLEIAGSGQGNEEGLKKVFSSVTSRTTDERFDGQKPNEVIKKSSRYIFKTLSKIASNPKAQNVYVGSLVSATQLPIFYVAIRFDVDKSSKNLWVILGAWQSEIVKNLPKSKYIDSYIIEERDRIFSATNAKLLHPQSHISSVVLGHLKQKENQPAGYIEEFKNQEGRRRLGAFSRSPKYKLNIIIEQDVEFAYEETKKNVINIGLWAILFVLFAIFLSYFGARGITRGLRDVTIATHRIAKGEFNHRIIPKTSDEVGALSHSINHMSERILSLLHAQIERARFEKELETAKMVQSTFFPKKDIESEFSRITGFYKPASECGGDLWAHFRVSPTKEYIFIGDAMGHGAPAALVTAMAYSIFTATLDIFKQTKERILEPKEILAQLNNIVFDAIEGKISMTAFVGMFDYDKCLFTYSNAGHNFPIIISDSAKDERFSIKKKVSDKYAHTTLSLTGLILGIEPNQKYNQKSISIKSGDRIALYTDGLIECRNPEGQAYGKKRFLESLLASRNHSAAKMMTQIVDGAFQFFDKEPLADDTTLVIVELLEGLGKVQKVESVLSAPSRHDVSRSQAEFNLSEQPIINRDELDPTQMGHFATDTVDPFQSAFSESKPQSINQTQSLLEKLRARRQKAS